MYTKKNTAKYSMKCSFFTLLTWHTFHSLNCVYLLPTHDISPSVQAPIDAFFSSQGWNVRPAYFMWLHCTLSSSPWKAPSDFLGIKTLLGILDATCMFLLGFPWWPPATYCLRWPFWDQNFYIMLYKYTLMWSRDRMWVQTNHDSQPLPLPPNTTTCP